MLLQGEVIRDRLGSNFPCSELDFAAVDADRSIFPLFADLASRMSRSSADTAGASAACDGLAQRQRRLHAQRRHSVAA